MRVLNNEELLFVAGGEPAIDSMFGGSGSVLESGTFSTDLYYTTGNLGNFAKTSNGMIFMDFNRDGSWDRVDRESDAKTFSSELNAWFGIDPEQDFWALLCGYPTDPGGGGIHNP